MNNSNNNVDNQYLLNVPLAYILQNRTVEEIERDFDSNGWSVLHHAIAEGDISKIAELIYFGFNWGVNGSTNFIPEFAYQVSDKRKQNRNRLLTRMPYCVNGYSPTHLAMYLFAHYNSLATEFSYQKLADHYKDILSALISDKTDWQSHIDSDGNSLLDYAFLSEDVSLIEMMQNIEPTFSNLKKVPPLVAKKILEVMNFKTKSSVPTNIISALDNKIMHDSLCVDLKINLPIKKSIQKL